MIMLVIGNGFDLAHQLPTSYPQFLEFVKMYKADDESVFPDDYFHKQLSQVMVRLKLGNDQTAKEAQDIFGKKQPFARLFPVCLQKTLSGRESRLD